ncbi:carbohydrate-binding protein [Glaciecola siphonariae]|uniref:Carbohydrate-binding protein n=1 Tax=Glaciecola siphonariae TaxID=521012 RepID=A0ABV9LX55_9ALTE
MLNAILKKAVLCLLVLGLFSCAWLESANTSVAQHQIESEGSGKILYVSKQGKDTNSGKYDSPFYTISKAAEVARAGDTIVVSSGTYRESIDPHFGGHSPRKMIHYRAAEGERVIIKGSEKMKGWEYVQDNVWQLTLPNAFFENYNPYNTKIRGDWFKNEGRDHHTGAVYANGTWLWESPDLATVLGKPFDAEAFIDEIVQNDTPFLMRLEKLALGESQISQSPPTFEGKLFAHHHKFARAIESKVDANAEDAILIKEGDWIRFKNVDLSDDAGFVRILASPVQGSRGGVVEIRANSPDGELLASASVISTASWNSSEVFVSYLPQHRSTQSLPLKTDLYFVFKRHDEFSLAAYVEKYQAALAKLENRSLWYASVNDTHTNIYAQINGFDPNIEGIEINVRETLFYPSKPNINYIRVNGFEFAHAATNWAPPTAEQKAAVGTHWSKGWIIENNRIRHARTVCLSLGKYGDEFDNTAADSAAGYVGTIERALARDWNKESVGGHLVRGNHISHCEQAGIAGSMGAIFSEITQNTIHDIHQQKLFDGYEMAGIKLHAPIDTLIARNHIFDSHRGIWLDWMTQGTRISENVLHDNDDQDLWLEVNHGPAIIDNNIFLSKRALSDWSQGNAYLHNLFAGEVTQRSVPERSTPYHYPHSTQIKGYSGIVGGDNHFINNLFVGSDLSAYAEMLDVRQRGNVFLPAAELTYKANALTPSISSLLSHAHTQTTIEPNTQSLAPITTAALGVTKVSAQGFTDPSGELIIFKNVGILK